MVRYGARGGRAGGAGTVLLAGALTLGLAVGLAGCGANDVTVPPATASAGSGAGTAPATGPAAGASASDQAGAAPRSGGGALPLVAAASAGDGSAGRGFDIPPIPDIVIPDVTVVDAASAKVQKQLTGVVSPVKGVSVSGARCDGDRVVTRAGVNYGDGSGVINRGGDSATNYGDGSGTYKVGTMKITNYGDGSGRFEDGALKVVNYGDGSGTYEDGTVSIVIYGDGSGTYDDGTVAIHNYGDGSGTYDDGVVAIHNYGDGSATYDTAGLSVDNNGDGTGDVNGEDVPMEPAAQIGPIGTLPTMKALKPLGKECGTLLRFEDRVLFDFGKATLRPEAGPVLDKVAQALASVNGTLQVNGHTDSIGSDQANQDLSERRAQAVADALSERGVGASFDVQGFGESQPVAANEVKGKDYPAGRQLNRRVEIVIPSS